MPIEKKDVPRAIFEQAVEVILDAEEDSPEFYLSFSIIRGYKMYVLEKKLISEKCGQEIDKCTDEFISSGCC